jgi:hypothetical protein
MNLSGTGVTNVKPAAGNGDSNARVLHQVLAANTTIETLVRACVRACMCACVGIGGRAGGGWGVVRCCVLVARFVCGGGQRGKRVLWWLCVCVCICISSGACRPPDLPAHVSKHTETITHQSPTSFFTPTHNTTQPQDVSNTGLDDQGVQEVCEGLKKNASVVALSLARNNFTSKVTDSLTTHTHTHRTRTHTHTHHRCQPL